MNSEWQISFMGGGGEEARFAN